MRLLIFLLLIAVLFFSCGDSTVPSGIIPEEKMGTIVWQLMQADEYASSLLTKDSTKKSSAERARLYQEVFDLNKTSKDEFKKSYQFYMARPDITKTMFDTIDARGSRLRSELFKPKDSSAGGVANMQRFQLQKRVEDSLAKAHGQHVGNGKPDSAVLKSILKDTASNKPKRDTTNGRLKLFKVHKAKTKKVRLVKKG